MKVATNIFRRPSLQLIRCYSAIDRSDSRHPSPLLIPVQQCNGGRILDAQVWIGVISVPTEAEAGQFGRMESWYRKKLIRSTAQEL